MLALLEHREGGLAFLFLLALAHLDDHRERPDVSERILEFPVSLAPELILQGQGRLRSCRDRSVPQLIHIVRVDVQVQGRGARGRGRLRIASREFVAHHEDRIPDLNRRVHQRSIRPWRAVNLLRSERLLVELDRLCRTIDDEVRRDSPHSPRDRTHSRCRPSLRWCLPCFRRTLCFACQVAPRSGESVSRIKADAPPNACVQSPSQSPIAISSTYSSRMGTWRRKTPSSRNPRDS